MSAARKYSEKDRVRQDRIVVNSPDFYILHQGEQYQIKDMSRYGIAVLTNHNPTLFEDLAGVPIFVGAEKVAEVDLKPVRRDQSGQSNFCAFEIMGEPLDVDAITARLRSLRLVSLHARDFTNQQSIPPKFRHMVYVLKDWMEQLRSKVAKLEASTQHSSKTAHHSFEDSTADVVSSFMASSLPPIFSEMHKALEASPPEEYLRCSAFLAEKVSQTVRAGRASADETPVRNVLSSAVRDLYSIDQKNMRFPILFSRILLEYFMKGPLRNLEGRRNQHLLDAFQSLYVQSSVRPVRILCEGSHGGHRLMHLLESHPELATANFLIDIIADDRDELKDLQRKLLDMKRSLGSTVELRFLHEPEMKLEDQETLRDYDCIFAFGLLNFVDDQTATRLLRRFHEALRVGGLLLVSGISQSRPEALALSLGIDASFVIRTDTDYQALFDDLDLEAEVDQSPEAAELIFLVHKN